MIKILFLIHYHMIKMFLTTILKSIILFLFAKRNLLISSTSLIFMNFQFSMMKVTICFCRVLFNLMLIQRRYCPLMFVQRREPYPLKKFTSFLSCLLYTSDAADERSSVD